MNYYVVLGVARDASYEAMRQAFRSPRYTTRWRELPVVR